MSRKSFFYLFVAAILVIGTAPAFSEVIQFQQGVSPTAAYAGCQDAHIISWDNSENQLSRNPDGTNAGSDPSTPAVPGGNAQNAGAHAYIEEGDYGTSGILTNDSKVILIKFDVSSIAAAQANRVRSAQVQLYFSHERSAGGDGQGPTNPAAGKKQPHLVNAQPILRAWSEGTGGGSGSNVDGVDAPDNSGAVSWNSTGAELWEAIGAEGPTDVGPVESSTYFDPTIPGHWVSFDVTRMARRWIANPASNNGVKLSQETDNVPENPATSYVGGAYNFVSRNNTNTANRPLLKVDLAGASNVGEEWSVYN